MEQSQSQFTSSGSSNAGAVSDTCYQDIPQVTTSENDKSKDTVVEYLGKPRLITVGIVPLVPILSSVFQCPTKSLHEAITLRLVSCSTCVYLTSYSQETAHVLH